MEYRQLGCTGLQVSKLSLGEHFEGSAPFSDSIYGKSSLQDGIETVREAIANGINYIDTAPWYGQGRAEECLGKVLRSIPRSSYYIGTKVGRCATEVKDMFDFSGAGVLQSMDDSLARLQLPSVDVIQVHDIEFCNNIDRIINETLPALQRIKDAGKARFIGITGYALEPLKRVVERSKVKIDVVLSYARATLFDNSLDAYLPYFKERQIGVINAAPTGCGLITSNGAPSWHPANSELKERCVEAVEYCQMQGVDCTKLACWYSMNKAGVDSTLIGAENPQIVRANLQAATAELSAKEQQTLEELRRKYFAQDSHWEGNEVAAYWQKMQLAGATQR